ncbi:hypothetical protein [Parapedobacter lycopersici]|uniref:hypothetical protein n=1 Tax=Parapedobacter lycopersici TaxID=1864939 RepID=UPI00333F4C52
MKEVLEKLEQSVRIISPSRKYWFVRTYSGRLFDDFLERKYIGIGYNQVPYNYIKGAKTRKSAMYKELHSFLLNTEKLILSEATKWANQLVNFEHKVNIDDIVIIPREGSWELAIGEVVGDTYLVDDKGTFRFEDGYESYPQKRKKIKWLKVLRRKDFLGDISNIFSSHQAISNISQYGDIIEGNISSVFIRDDYSFFNIRINQDEEINAFELNRLLSSITFFYKEVCNELEIENNEDLTIKIKVQSKGGIAFKGIAIGGLLAIAGIFAMSKRPNVSIQIGNYIKFEGESEGFLPALSDFLDRSVERQLKLKQLSESNEALEASTVDEEVPEEIENTDIIADDTTRLDVLNEVRPALENNENAD